ncbi:MAG: glycosyltransferase family 2 protein [Candidatus Aureabacteria bacterium]|nr:glycosyltransferase family 2 protein [Candidatus Auribacterota bacterium]
MNACAVIPAFNEAEHIGAVVAGVRVYLPKVIVVDDGSSDGTAEAARRAGAVVILHEKNRGMGVAMKTGMGSAFDGGYDVVIVLDGDGQHDTAEIPLFLEAARRGDGDIIVGNRMGNTEGMPLTRYLTNRFTSFCISKVAGQRIPDSQCGYRCVNKKAFMSMCFRTERYDTESEILIDAARAGCRIGTVPVRTIYGAETSKINPFLDAIRFFKLLLRHVKSRRAHECGTRHE